MATSSRAFGQVGHDDDDVDLASDDESGDSIIDEADNDAPLSSARQSVISDVDSIAAITVNALQIPDTSAARRRQQRQRKKRTSAQVRRIMGWYPAPAIERTIASEQAKVESLRDTIAHSKSAELQHLVARLNGRTKVNDDGDDYDYDDDGIRGHIARDPDDDLPEARRGSGQITVASSKNNQNTDQLLELARTVTALERHVTAVERAYRGEHVYSSASTVQFSLPSAGAFNFSPGTAVPTSLGSEPMTPNMPPAEVHRVFSRKLVDLYESVDAIHVPDDDRTERYRFLERHRLAMRGHASARVLQATFRMHRCRRKFLKWRQRRRHKLAVALHAWRHLHQLEAFGRRNACRRVFREWADEVECTLKLRTIELRLLQQSATKVATVSNLVKNLFLTTSDDFTTPPLHRKGPDYSYVFVNEAFAAVQDTSKDAVAVGRIAAIRAEMRAARETVAKQFVHTLFLKWKAYHEKHKRTSVNAQLSLRRAMRIAFLRRPKWLGERVQVVFEMWARYTLFQKHKRACMAVPRFPTPLAQWDLWVVEYKARQLRKLEAQARSPLMWMTRYYRLLRAYCNLSKSKKAENRRARAYCSRRHLGIVFAKWRTLTLLNLETRGSMKKALYAWQTYTAMRADCRVPKRKMQLRTRDARVHKAWEGWKETQSRRSVLALDRRMRLLQPSMYPRALTALYHWANITSQETKTHLFHRWASRVYRRKALVKLWTEATRLHGRVLLQATFTAWRRHLAGTSAADQHLSADPVAIDALLESALPFVFLSDAYDSSLGDTSSEVGLSELHAFHVLVRNGQASEMEALLLEHPRLASAREPVLGNNALHIAAQGPPKHMAWTVHRHVLRLLVQAGASPFARNLVGDSALSLVSDPETRHSLQATGYGFHALSRTACNTSMIDTRVLWHLLLRLGIELRRGDRAFGDPDVGTWHTVDMMRPLPSTKWDPPPNELRRRPFLCILANKLLQRPVVEAAEANAPGLLQEWYLAKHLQLLRDREILPDSCTFQCFKMPDFCVDVRPKHAIMPAFHSSFYYGRDLARTTEHNLRVDLVGPLLGKRPPLDAIADQVEQLAVLARAAEAQLLQVERNNAPLLPLDGVKCYGSVAEELQGVDSHLLDVMLCIYFKLQQVRMLDKASEKLPAFTALQSAIPTETALLQRLDRAVDDHSRDVKKACTATAAAKKKLALYQNAYTSLFTTIKQAPLSSGDAIEKLIATRMQVDEALLGLASAARQQKKQETAQTRLETLQTIYRDLLNEQRTWTKNEFAILDAMLVIQTATMDTLSVTIQTVDARRRALLDEITQRHPDDRLARRNIKSTAKKLLLQLHVLHQTHAACELLLVHDVGGRVRPPSALAPAAVVATSSVDDVASVTTVSPLVSEALQHHMPARVAPPNCAIAESVLVQAYKRSMVLLFAEERRIIANDVERRDADAAKKREVFFEASPVAAMPHETATPTDVDRMDRTRRETRLINNTPTFRRRTKAEAPPNRKRLELQKARISMVSRAAASDATSSHDKESYDADNDRLPTRLGTSVADALLTEPRTIEGMQYTFGNFASRAFYDKGPSTAALETTATDQVDDDAIESIWRSHGEIASLSAATLALKTRVFESQTNTVKATETVAHPTLARSNSRVGRRRSLEAKLSSSLIEDVAEAPEVELEAVIDVVAPDRVEATATMTLVAPPKSPESARLTAPVSPPPSVATPRDASNDGEPTPALSARSNATDDDNGEEEPPRTPLMLRIGMPPMTPPAPRVSISAELGLTSSDLLANLESFAFFSQTLLHKQQPLKPATSVERPTLGSSLSTPELDVSAPLSSSSSRTEPRMRLFHELVQRDDSIVKRRDPKRRWRTKRSVPRYLPALETSFSLDGRAFAALHQTSTSLPAPRSPPRCAPAPSSTDQISNNNNNEDDNNEDDKDNGDVDEHRTHLARIELLYNPENDPGRAPLSMDRPKYNVKTLLEHRPFNGPPVANGAPAPPTLSNVVLCGSQLLPPTLAPTSLLPTVAAETLLQETMTKDDKSKVWAAFTAKPLPTAIQAAYAELYPGTYLTATPLRRDAIKIPASMSMPELPRPSMGGVASAIAPSLLGRKSTEICFWQAVEGYKSIRDESIHGLVLAPAKVRRKRRSVEIAHEFLTPQSPQALHWILLEYPDVIATIEQLVQGETVPATTFNELQRAVERRLAMAHAPNPHDDNASTLL